MNSDLHLNKCNKSNNMEFEDSREDDSSNNKNINELPDEVLEYIFSLVSPYRDLKECMLVCKRWRANVKNVVRLLSLKLTNAINSMDFAWQTISPVEMAPTITKRYSHSACYHENSMYVFGGCTSTSTTFNDLWRLDLNKRQWVRPLTMGTYPSPKACASMVHYKDALIVFGGWTLPSPYPHHQAWRLFSELHIYSIVKNRWMCINTASSPPGMAGHSASVHEDTMVVFGGLKSEVNGLHSSSNDVWCFNLETQEWHKQATSGVKPHARYGQSQIWLDDHKLLIIGGCGGPNMIFNDVWLLTMVGEVWQWRQVNVLNREWSATYMWCHRACKVGNLVVMMSRDPRPLKRKTQNGVKSKPRPRSASALWIPPRYEESAPDIPRRVSPAVCVDKDSNVNGQRGTFSKGAGARQPANGCARKEAACSLQYDCQPGSSFMKVQDGAKRMISSDSQPMSCEPSLSGLSNHCTSKAGDYHSDAQPGPSGVSKQSSESRSMTTSKVSPNSSSTPGCSFNSSKISPGRNNNQDNQGTSPPAPNVNNWDRLRPFNRSPGADNRLQTIQLAAFQDQDQAARTCPSRARERQLQALQRFEQRMRFNNQPQVEEPPAADETSSVKLQRTMVVCVMDISNVLTEDCSVRWLALSPDTCSNGPEETILYTLVAGRGELIMFGGIHREAITLMTNTQSNSASNLSNSLHFISAPHGVI